MKTSIPPHYKVLAPMVICFALTGLSANAADYYFDTNGTEANFVEDAGPFDWDTGEGASTHWSPSSAGTAETIQWVNGNTAIFSGRNKSGGTSSGFTVNLLNNVTIAGMTTVNATMESNRALVFSAASTKTITLLPGAIINNDFGGGRPIVIGDNVNLVGDIILTSGRVSTSQAGILQIQGEGDLYVGTITTSGYATIRSAQNQTSRFGTGTRIVLNEGGTFSVDADVTIGELSGNGGSITRGGNPGRTFTLNQSTRTQWQGMLGGANPNVNFIKSGVGTLSLTGDVSHTIANTLTVSGGSLYASEAFSATSGSIGVGVAGNFGGTTTTSKKVELNGATSRLSPGMLDEEGNQLVGTMTLANGIEATLGGTFVFALNGDDGTGSVGNSQFVLSGGAITLNADPSLETFTIRLLDLGFTELAGSTHTVTLFSTTDMVSNFATFASRWELDENYLPPGWSVEGNPFSVVNNGLGQDLNFTFSVTAVPEPSTIGFIVMGLLGGVAFAMKRRKSGV